MSDQLLTEVTLYVCDECGYFRAEYSTGRHQTPNPKDPRGRMAVHDLKAVKFVREMSTVSFVRTEGKP